MLLSAVDSTPDEQPQQTSEGNERREVAAEEENRMEVNCNGHASTPESEASPESQVHGIKQSTEELEDQQNANQPETNTEADDTLPNKEDHLKTCNGSSRDLEPPQLPASLSPDSVTVELKEGDKAEKKEEEMDTQGENKRRDDEDEDSQNGWFKKKRWILDVLCTFPLLLSMTYLMFWIGRRFELCIFTHHVFVMMDAQVDPS